MVSPSGALSIRKSKWWLNSFWIQALLNVTKSWAFSKQREGQNKKYLRFFPPIFYISKYSNWLVGSGNKQVTTIPKDLHTCSSPIISILLLGNRRTTLFAVEPDSQTGKHLSFLVSSLLWCTLKKVFSIGLSRESIVDYHCDRSTDSLSIDG